MTPLLSIIVPLYNKAPYIKTTLDSILSQGYNDMEIIVVNDGSTDDGAAIVKQIEDPRLKLISQPNKGVSAARNAGIAEATGRWIYLLDGDDMMMPGALMEVIPLLKLEKYDVIVTSYANSHNGIVKPAKRHLKEGLLSAPFFNKFIGRFYYVTGSIFVKGETAKKILFDTTLRRYEDDPVYCRWLMSGKVYFLPIAMMCYNHEGNSASLINPNKFESDYLAHLIFMPGKFWYNATMGQHLVEAYKSYPSQREALKSRYGMRAQFYRYLALLRNLMASFISL